MYKQIGLSVLLSAMFVPNALSNSFKDDFSWGFNPSIWTPRTGENSSPFGCTFEPGLVSPSSHGITLIVDNKKCAELQSTNAISYGKVQGALKTGNTAGTVSSIFTYTSWFDEPGRAWQEIDIEFLPSLGNVVHTNIIYQPDGGIYQSWEQDIDLDQFDVNIQNDLVKIGFEWSQQQIRWFIYNSQNEEQTLRVAYKDNGDGRLSSNEIPAYAWPVDPTKLMINHWHGDNSQQAYYFPGQYYQSPAWAYYDFIQYEAY
ncbi:family 16 glycosylhydrolase [Pseudoalteromonas agarivorans]|uniref:family 16 glycosylhydrolase n=1 Tax=Pseudoalteromonas agarivorans TaxID=176102 RepID=UPI00311F8131